MNLYLMLLCISVLVAWFMIGAFVGLSKRKSWGQRVRTDGPETHIVKEGTPTMGGIPFVLAALLVFVVYHLTEGATSKGSIAMFAIVGSAAVGALDDYLLVRSRMLGLKERGGLMARFKMSLQVVVALGFALAAAQFYAETGSAMYWWNVLLFTVVLTGSANAFNFTDGLDGLCAGVALIVILPLLFVSGVAAIIIGVLVAFLWFNWKPASIFMGDTGSHALGAAAAALYILYGQVWILPVAAFVPVMEVVTVSLQVTYFRYTKGKRIFLMTPIHHHFEKLGWPETKIVGRFYVISVLSTALAWGLWGLK